MDAVRIAQELIALDSVTTKSNAAVSQRLSELLLELDFEIELLPYTDAHGTPKINLAARRASTAREDSATASGIGFFCHSDVVSVDGWNCEYGGPFAGRIAQGRLWGRGACDMKGPTAAALVAISQIDQQLQNGPIYFFITGDEECGMSGARLLTQQSAHFTEMVARQAVGVICEPTALQVVNAHKGGCHIDITSTGVAAHSSSAEGCNANWQMIPLLTFMEQLNRRCNTDTRLRNEDFSPPTMTMNLVIENIPCSSNITVGQAVCRIFFRPMPGTDWQTVSNEIVGEAQRLKLDVHALQPLRPLCTPASSPFVQTSLQLLGQTVPRAVSYATDGCCFEQLPELIVIGPGNIEQAHRADEWIDLAQLERGIEVYRSLIHHYAIGKGTTN